MGSFCLVHIRSLSLSCRSLHRVVVSLVSTIIYYIHSNLYQIPQREAVLITFDEATRKRPL